MITNPHHPFTYRYFEIRHDGDRGDRFDADVLQLRDGWGWSARYTSSDEGDGLTTGLDAPGGRGLATEAEAVSAATACLCDGAGGPVAINIPKEPTR